MGQSDYVSGVERYFDPDEIIVSKTDLKGRLTYANRPFLDLSGYTEKEILGQPHSMIRHPAMPRCIFKVLWGAIEQGKEIFAYVNNRAKNGDNYWVYAHVTPSLSVDGQVVGYHSNRRVPDRDILEREVFPLYATLKSVEDKHANRKEGLAASEKAIGELLTEKGMDYTEYIVTLGQRRRRGYR